jgi:hypothetical protein
MTAVCYSSFHRAAKLGARLLHMLVVWRERFLETSCDRKGPSAGYLSMEMALEQR